MDWSSVIIPSENGVLLNEQYHLFYTTRQKRILNLETNTFIDISTPIGDYIINNDVTWDCTDHYNNNSITGYDYHLPMFNNGISIIIKNKLMYLFKYNYETMINYRRIRITITRYNLALDVCVELNKIKIAIDISRGYYQLTPNSLIRTIFEDILILPFYPPHSNNNITNINESIYALYKNIFVSPKSISGGKTLIISLEKMETIILD